MDVIVIETPQLGDRSYLVHDGRVGLVIDAQRDIDRVEAVAVEAGITVTHVAETHMHNDYLTGGLIYAQKYHAAYLVNAEDKVPFERTPIADGETVTVGELAVKAIATPGHTHNHLSFVVEHGDEQAVFSGGSVLYGSVGRTDLLGDEHTIGLTHDQYASARRLAEEAGAAAALYPTHGFGSFCSSGPATGAAGSTLGDQFTANHVYTDQDEAHFVSELIANLTAYPSYYVHMGPGNEAGPGEADLTVPESLDPEELRARLDAGEWVVDLRNRVAYASEHLKGSVSFEYRNGNSFTTYLGWLFPYGKKLTLVGSRDDVENAIRDLSRIGIESPDASLGQDPAQIAPEAPVSSYPRVGWEGMLENRPAGEAILDVRRADEYKASRIEGAVNIPLHELLSRLDELPSGRLWVHCGSGYRSGIAASLLDRAGYDVVQVDGAFERAAGAGLPIEA
ncbi:MBL fold metallo-hydrolase [Sinomonas terrae]|uniref:MBL fold metallo-hydrolase n=1 Tax=Sinomonas terrae TaxID=2908838 RepID=A0ABS9U588_9MICC|nr:MBL fold metallo-hydrolase [Sinomonas terrae]MCH6471847.1 MBL fold metallo-hydrolase [Sinomonas terrae]HKU12605.1 MBL fold metallo-hydrolase [Sinomonas sp.]